MTVQETASRGAPAEMTFGVLLAAYLVLVVGFAWNPTPLAQALAAIGILAACVHAALFYGWKDALALFSICVVVTFARKIWAPSRGFRSATITSRSERTCRMSASSR
jgi:putative membrane protein